MGLVPLRVCETVYTKSLRKFRNVQFQNGNCDKIRGILHVSTFRTLKLSGSTQFFGKYSYRSAARMHRERYSGSDTATVVQHCFHCVVGIRGGLGPPAYPSAGEHRTMLCLPPTRCGCSTTITVAWTRPSALLYVSTHITERYM